MAESDRLARYRRPEGREVYQAFKAVDRERYRLKIRPVWRAWERMLYAHLWRIMENGFGTQIGLIFSFAVVIIKGRNLDDLAEAIDRHCCEFIQEYDKDQWEEPSDPKAPFIETIDIYVETREDIVKGSDQALTDMAKSRSAQAH